MSSLFDNKVLNVEGGTLSIFAADSLLILGRASYLFIIFLFASIDIAHLFGVVGDNNAVSAFRFNLGVFGGTSDVSSLEFPVAPRLSTFRLTAPTSSQPASAAAYTAYMSIIKMTYIVGFLLNHDPL